MAIYRFNVEAKISQVVAIKADSREEVRSQTSKLTKELACLGTTTNPKLDIST